MFDQICIPYESVMVLTEVYLKPGILIEDLELYIGEVCHFLRNEYASDGFIAGQFSQNITKSTPEQHVMMFATYWRSIEQKQHSDFDEHMKYRFSELYKHCVSVEENVYTLLWQGESVP